MLSSEKPQKRTMSIYATHGGMVVIKNAARQCSKNEPYLLVECVDDQGFWYKIVNGEALIQYALKDDYLDPDKKDVFINYVQSHVARLNPTDFIEYSSVIASYLKAEHINLRVDANLSKPASTMVTSELHRLVHGIKPMSLILFSETAECRDDAQDYLDRKLTKHGYQLPLCEMSGRVVSRAGLNNAILDEQRAPAMVPVSQTSPTMMLYHSSLTNNEASFYNRFNFKPVDNNQPPLNELSSEKGSSSVDSVSTSTTWFNFFCCCLNGPKIQIQPDDFVVSVSQMNSGT